MQTVSPRRSGNTSRFSATSDNSAGSTTSQDQTRITQIGPLSPSGLLCRECSQQRRLTKFCGGHSDHVVKPLYKPESVYSDEK